MSPRSTIEWTDAHWEPVGGCTRASEGCRHCYAERLIGTRLATNPATRGRYEGLTRPTSGGPRFTGLMSWWPDRLDEPLRRCKPTRYFVCSQSDLFHDARDLEEIALVLGVAVAADWHTMLLLTKRPEVMRKVFDRYTPLECVSMAYAQRSDAGSRSRVLDMLLRRRLQVVGKRWQDLPHIWCGVSAEDQPTFDARWPVSRQVPAAVHWVSYEPALGPLEIATWMHSDMADDGPCGLRWIIAGAESGPGARPAPLEWVRSVRDQVLAARGGRETPLPGDPHLFVKQWCDGTGQLRKGCPALDGRVWAEVPEGAA